MHAADLHPGHLHHWVKRVLIVAAPLLLTG
jgi:hypothetical protein